MKPRSISSLIIVYVLLIIGSIIFVGPFVWLISTSLKPIEQTMSMPPTWVPRAYYTNLNGNRTEVIKDYQLTTPALIVSVTSEEKERKILLPPGDYHAERGTASVAVFKDNKKEVKELPARLIKQTSPGDWHVTEWFENQIRSRAPLWDVVPEGAIDSAIRPHWENYPKALSIMGGLSIEEYEGTVTKRTLGKSIDSQVSFFTFLTNTLTVCILGVIGAVFSNAIVAYGFAKIKWPGRDLMFALTLATMMIPFPVLMVPIFKTFKTLGWVGTLKPLWVPSFFASAFNIFLIRQFYRTIPEELSEAARIDGCSEWQILWRVILPLSKPVLAVVALFHFLHSWNDFMAPLLYLTRKHTFTLAIALQNFKSQQGGVQWHFLMAASAVIVLPIIVLFFMAQKTFIRGIATSGIKG